jgi:hypothetical protein
MNTIYGHLQFNLFFKELFIMTDNGIQYKGKEYLWNDVQKIKRTIGSYAVNLCYPGAKIYLNDKKKIWINGRIFRKAGDKLHFKPSGFLTGESKTFSEFIELMKQKGKMIT